MNKIEEKAKAALPDLLLYMDKALALAETMGRSVSWPEDDDFGFVALCFLHKQTEHARSIKLLVDEGYGRDAQIVGRAMQETMASLLWIAHQPSDRAFQWRGFAYVEDWRLMQRQRDAGETVNAKEAQRTDAFLSRHGYVFLSSRPKKPGQRGNRLSIVDPYHSNWRCGTTIGDIFREVHGESLYRELYGPFSDWIHEGPKGITAAIHRENKTVKWIPAQSSTNATVFATAFQCLVQTSQVVDQHFGMSFGGKIQDLTGKYEMRFPP